METTQYSSLTPRGIQNRKQESRLGLDPSIQALVAEGLTHRQIAERLGVHETTIERRCKWLGLQSGRRGPRFGPGHPEWRGGRKLDKYGYIEIWAPLHPRASCTGYVGEHTLVMELHLNRPLLPKEVIHHLDNCPYHNWPENMEVFSSNADHLRHELTGRSQSKLVKGTVTTPRIAIPGAYRCNQTLARCPNESETLAQCPLEINQRLSFYIESFRPTIEHRNLPLRLIRGTGAWRNPFQLESRE